MIFPEVPTPTMVLFDATFVIEDSAIVPLTRTVWALPLCTALMKAEAVETVTVPPPAPPVVAAPKPTGPAAAAASGSAGAEPLAVPVGVTAMTTAVAVAAARVNRALVLRMWNSVRGGFLRGGDVLWGCTTEASWPALAEAHCERREPGVDYDAPCVDYRVPRGDGGGRSRLRGGTGAGRGRSR
ncbi:hypothetical protein GCM10010238_32410 [Streptomyces griseoviridis]|uniref:Uncharacterized protein n=1 Tax=Streptomyces griseoviridis TaxID=45398 RepID=A0A918LFM3_STRGD|nr:hypothetical protein GCM10010238_32410 [Streptomyces niveoruber]